MSLGLSGFVAEKHSPNKKNALRHPTIVWDKIP